MDQPLESQGKMETLSSEMLECYEGFRKFQDIPLIEYLGDYHIYTYCINKDGTHWVFQDAWADPTDSIEEQGEDDLFLGEASLKILKDAEKEADMVMTGYCYGRQREVPITSEAWEDTTSLKMEWEVSCDPSDEKCTDVEYPDYPASYSITRGCYCYGWQQLFRDHAGFPLESITGSAAGIFLNDDLLPS